jgi:hydrogenase maturation protease
MADLRNALRQRLTGRTCLMGIGNPDRGDDGFGVRLAEAVHALGVSDVIVAERTPERFVPPLRRGDFQTILFLDTVEMGAAPGDVALWDACEIVGRYPQLSTHKLSLGTLARLIEIETDGATRVFLLGVQPQSVDHTLGLSEPVQTTLDVLRDLLAEILPAGTQPLAVCGERP